MFVCSTALFGFLQLIEAYPCCNLGRTPPIAEVMLSLGVVVPWGTLCCLGRCSFPAASPCSRSSSSTAAHLFLRERSHLPLRYARPHQPSERRIHALRPRNFGRMPSTPKFSRTLQPLLSGASGNMGLRTLGSSAALSLCFGLDLCTTCRDSR